MKRSQPSVVENRPPGSATASSSCSQGPDCATAAASSNHNSSYASPLSEGVSWSAGSSNGSSSHSEPYNGRNGTCDGEPHCTTPPPHYKLLISAVMCFFFKRIWP